MKRIALALLLLALFSGCSLQLTPKVTPDQNKVNTAVAKTLTVAPPVWTPLPTNTLRPTFAQPTQAPSRTPLPTNTQVPSITPTPGLKATPLPGSLLPGGVIIEGIGCLPPSTQQDLGVVMKVLTGDTIEVFMNNTTKTVRYIGVQTPLLGSGSRPPARLAPEALQKNKALVTGKVVVLVKDVTEKDSSGNLLRYVIADTAFVNYELVRQGFAISLATPPDITCQKTFDAAQALAMQAKMNLWVPTPTLPAGVTPIVPTSVHK